MKSIVLFPILLVLGFTASAQCTFITDDAFKQTESKDGKITKKECQWVALCDGVVEFRVSATSVQTFKQIEGSNVWVNTATQKIVLRIEQEDGLVVFWTNEKTAFVYPKPTTDESQ